MAAHVLIVDSDQRFTPLLASYVRERGFTARVVHRGRDALACLRQERFDVTMTELDLPDIEGLEVVGELVGATEAGAVIVCTRAPRVRAWDEHMLRRLGLAAAIVRPARLEQIAATLDRTAAAHTSRASASAAG